MFLKFLESIRTKSKFHIFLEQGSDEASCIIREKRRERVFAFNNVQEDFIFVWTKFIEKRSYPIEHLVCQHTLSILIGIIRSRLRKFAF